MNRCRFLTLLFAYMLIALHPQPLLAKKFSIHDAITMALTHNPSITAAEAEVASAASLTKAAQGARLPSLDITTGINRSNSPLAAFGSLLQQRSIAATDFSPQRLNNPGYITNYQSQATLAVPLYHGGAINAAIAEGDAQTTMQQARQRTIRQTIIARVISAFINAKASQAEISARREAIAAAQQQLHDSKQLQQQGMALESDIIDAKAHLLQSKLALVHSQNIRADNIDALRQLTTDNRLTITGDIAIHPIQGTLPHWIAQAIAQRADLQAIIAQRQALKQRQAQQQASWLPNIDLVASQQWNSGTIALHNRNSAIGVTVGLNLFNGGSDRARIAAIGAQQQALDANIIEKKGAIRQQIRRRWRQKAEAEMKLASSKLLLQQQQEALRIRKLRHQQGLETSRELLRSQVSHDDAQVATIHARYSLLQTTALLYLDAGALTAEVIQ